MERSYMKPETRTGRWRESAGGFFLFFQFFHIFSCTNVVRVLSFYYICSEIIDRIEHYVDEI